MMKLSTRCKHGHFVPHQAVDYTRSGTLVWQCPGPQLRKASSCIADGHVLRAQWTEYVDAGPIDFDPEEGIGWVSDMRAPVCDSAGDTVLWCDDCEVELAEGQVDVRLEYV